MSQLNVEFKARCANLEIVRGILSSEGADYRGTDRQKDTYFKVSEGRLKLREGKLENNLIYYSRTDMEGPRESEVTLFPTDSESPLKEILEKSLGVLVVVEKTREIYLKGNVKIHLDSIEDLGTFVEVEAMAEGGDVDKEKLKSQCHYFLDLFDVSNEDLISTSYSDMLPVAR